MDDSNETKEDLYNFIITKISILKTKENMDILDWIQSTKDDFTYEQLREIFNIINVEDYNKAVSKKLLDYIISNTEDEEERIKEEERLMQEEERIKEERIKEERIKEEERLMQEEERIKEEKNSKKKKHSEKKKE